MIVPKAGGTRPRIPRLYVAGNFVAAAAGGVGLLAPGTGLATAALGTSAAVGVAGVTHAGALVIKSLVNRVRDRFARWINSVVESKETPSGLGSGGDVIESSSKDALDRFEG
ncbi:hypothetical protein ACFUG9_23610 [Streptomyces griseoincarnatus]